MISNSSTSTAAVASANANMVQTKSSFKQSQHLQQQNKIDEHAGILKPRLSLNNSSSTQVKKTIGNRVSKDHH